MGVDGVQRVPQLFDRVRIYHYLNISADDDMPGLMLFYDFAESCENPLTFPATFYKV